MKGNIQLIRNYGDDSQVMFSETNMAVDGMRQTIADIMTHMPDPSSVPGGTGYLEPGVSSVSSYQIQAFSLGSAKGYYDKRDSRFFYSAGEYSGYNYQLLPLKKDDYFEMYDCYSGIGYNSWKYTNLVDANLIQSPTLENLNDWTITYAVPDNPSKPTISSREESFGEQIKQVTKFEQISGQQRVTLRQRVDLNLGNDYFLYTNGRSHQATFDFRIGRGRGGMVFEYYNFNSRKFIPKTTINEGTRNTISLPSTFEVDEFRFQLKGNSVDQPFLENQEYYIEYVFPSKSFVDRSFSPWQENYINPFVDIISLELCDAKHQILPNPNFLNLQSRLINSNFDNNIDVDEFNSANPALAKSLGYKNFLGWESINPILNSMDPATEEVNGTTGYIKAVTDSYFENTVFSSMSDGVVFYTSGTDLTNYSGGVSLNQTFTLGDDVRNNYAFPTAQSDTPSNLNAANGQGDNNSTLMLSFETMVSGASTANNCGHLQIKLRRSSDGYEYLFSANPTINTQRKFYPNGEPLIVPYSSKDTWVETGVPILLDADSNRDSYTLEIKGSGRTDQANGGFCNYAIKNLKLGPFEGWRVYGYDKSSISTWSLSSQGYSNLASGLIYSGLSFSGPAKQKYGWSSTYIDKINNSKEWKTDQLVQNFNGMEPTKSYRLSIKGTAETFDTITYPSFGIELKAKGQFRVPGKNNILSNYMMDGPNVPFLSAPVQYSSVNEPVSPLNPYSNDSNSTRRTFPSFQSVISDDSVKPTDWGVLVTASGTDSNSVAQYNARGDAGTYFLSMDVFNSTDEGSYFFLSALPNHMYNWDNGQWDSITSALPQYRSAASGSYYLKLPGKRNEKNFTHFKYDHPIYLNSAFLTPLIEQTPDNTGPRGEFRIAAGVYGPNANEGQTLVNNIRLEGNGEYVNTDIWKELYYHWDTNEWKPGYYKTTSTATKTSSDVGTTRNFIITPEQLVTNMCLSGLNKNTEFQLNIVDLSGGKYILNDVALTDVSLIANPGNERWVRNPGVFTSELYADSQYYEYDHGIVIKQFGGNGITDGFNPANIATQNPYNSPTFDSLLITSATDRVPFIRFDDVKTGGVKYPWIIKNFTLDEYGIGAGEKFACGVDVALTDIAGQPTLELALEARVGGKSYQYDLTNETWTQGFSRREKSYNIKEVGINRGGGDTIGVHTYRDVNQFTRVFSPQVVAPNFGPNTKLIVSMRIVPSDGNTSNAIIKDFGVYRTTEKLFYRFSGDTFQFPEFPTPMDDSLQSRGLPNHPDELGQFLNRIEFFDFGCTGVIFGPVPGGVFNIYSSTGPINNPMSPSITGEHTLEQAVAMGGFLPSAGMFFTSGSFGSKNPPDTGRVGTLSGLLNTMGVVNSDGYIYPFPPGRTVTNELDASAGFLTSSFYSPKIESGWTYKPKTMRYVLKVLKDDWKFIDYYMGGVGAMGLNVFDYKKTYDKLGTSFMTSATNFSYSQGSKGALYKVTDPSRNPVFRLTNKKVMFPPGLQIDYNTTDCLTIIWDIDFLS
tara:strand:- start:58 stop:4596 length:4539 start_codon:yes stop_codon:yes gene_type:complete